jgi:hypothetical protein
VWKSWTIVNGLLLVFKACHRVSPSEGVSIWTAFY